MSEESNDIQINQPDQATLNEEAAKELEAMVAEATGVEAKGLRDRARPSGSTL